MPQQANARRPEKTSHPGIFKKGNRYIDTWKERGKPRSQSYPTITAAKRGRAERIALGKAPHANASTATPVAGSTTTAAAPSAASTKAPATSTARSSRTG